MRSSDWRTALLWIGCFAVTLLVMGWFTRQESDQQIKLEAERHAQGLASSVSRAIPP
jgi:hypothetical protein